MLREKSDYSSTNFKSSKLSFESSISEEPTLKNRDAEIEFAHELLRDVFRHVTVKLGETTEAKIAAMMNYILAICVKLGQTGENFREYISAVYIHAGKVKTINGFRFFSPLTKNDLTYEELIREVEKFEEVK